MKKAVEKVPPRAIAVTKGAKDFGRGIAEFRQREEGDELRFNEAFAADGREDRKTEEIGP